jgi:two-component system, NtrC family, sensor kinase
LIELKDTQQKLIHSAKLATIGELVAGVSHEIKNPLTGILGFVSMLKENSVEKETQPLLDGLDTSAKHLQKVVLNFLAFSKRTETQFQPLDINQVISNTLSLVSHQVRGQGIEIETKLNTSLAQISGDFNQLTQVFTNIVMNAADAMPKGGYIYIKSYDKELKGKHYILIDIKDTGTGIPAKIINQIFDSFFTTKGYEKGTGLGLSISKGIIENHGGKIQVRSKIGKGTVFTILLPSLLKK